MLTLSLETSTQGFGVALHQSHKLIAQAFDPEMKQGSAQLLPVIDRLLVEQGIAPTDLKKILVSKGPGSFTGIRLGIATAQALSLGLGVPWYSLSTFEICAHAYLSHFQKDPQEGAPTEIFIGIDTRGQQLSCASFFLPKQVFSEITYGPPAHIAASLPLTGACVVGTGLDRLLPFLPHPSLFTFYEVSGYNLAVFLGEIASMHPLHASEGPFYGVNPYTINPTSTS